MVDFTDILNKPVESVEKPKPKPAGSYLAQVMGMPKQTSRQMQGEEVAILQFALKPLSPREDVDQEELAGVPPLNEWPNFYHEFWMNRENSQYNLKKFLTDVLECTGSTFGEMLAQAPGKQVIMTLGHEPYQDKNTGEMEIATRIKGVAKA